jgi:hypothetical protein
MRKVFELSLSLYLKPRVEWLIALFNCYLELIASACLIGRKLRKPFSDSMPSFSRSKYDHLILQLIQLGQFGFSDCRVK